MRKEEIRGLIVYSILIAVALIVGLTAIADSMYSYAPKMNQFLFVLIVIAVSYLFNVIGHELLHALGAVLGGYKVVSINILGLCFENNGERTKVCFREYSGLSGETKIAPGKKEKKNLNLFVWVPIFGYAIEAASAIAVMTSMRDIEVIKGQWLIPASILFILISSMIAFYELVPLRLDCENDGYRMRLFASSINVKAYNEMLNIQEMQRQGKTIKNVTIFTEITEYTAECNLYGIYVYLGQENYKKAEEIINILLDHKNKLSTTDTNRLIAQKLYVEILTKPLEEAKKTYDEITTSEVRRFIANDVSMEAIRAYILIAGMIEGSQGEVTYAQSRIKKAKKRALPSQIEVEEKLTKQAVDYVYKNHPKWVKENAAE